MITNATNKLDSPAELLKTAYKQLAFDQGALLFATRQTQSGALGNWLDFRDWQSLAAQVGAENFSSWSAVFAPSEDGSSEVLRGLYEQIWCMSRPQLLLLVRSVRGL